MDDISSYFCNISVNMFAYFKKKAKDSEGIPKYSV